MNYIVLLMMRFFNCCCLLVVSNKVHVAIQIDYAYAIYGVVEEMVQPKEMIFNWGVLLGN